MRLAIAVVTGVAAVELACMYASFGGLLQSAQVITYKRCLLMCGHAAVAIISHEDNTCVQGEVSDLADLSRHALCSLLKPH